MKGAKNIVLTIISIAFFSLVITNRAVFAASTITVSVSPSTVTMDAIPGVFTSASQTISVSTNNSTGYVASLSPSGASNALIHESDSTATIPTFTIPSGSSSLPANSTGYGYGYSVDGGLNYLAVPAPGANQAIFETNNSGSFQHTLTFGSLVPTGTLAGLYENTLTIEVVAKLTPCPFDTICYYGNGDDETGTMPDQSAASNTEVTLIPSNFSRTGYGFAGWNTAADGSGTNYGPNETITTGDLSLEGLQLYARWIQSSGDLQGWNGCDSLSQGSIIALTDTRDGNTYAVTKYVDNQCWMMENLRLDLSSQNLQISVLNTNNPTAAFTNTINGTHPASTNTFCAQSTTACDNSILHNTNNTNRNLTASYDANNTSSSWYSYGNYYNWHTITAGNGSHDDSTAGATVNGDLCPASWRLPTGYGNTGDLAKLDIALGGTGVNQASGTAAGLTGTVRWRKYPLNFLYSGEQKGNTAANRAISSSYATQNAASAERTANLWIKTDGVYMNSNNTYKYRGQTARCVFKGSYSVGGNVHYDANGGTGTMADETNVDFGTAVSANNAFTMQHATFVNWNTQPDGSGVSVAEGSMVAAAAASLSLSEGDTLTLYAIWDPVYTLIYAGNGSDAGSMSSVTVNPLRAGTERLVASNFSRSGYGFAGWSLDYDAATKLANGTPVTIYGPNELVTINNSFLSYADADNQVNLYAVWLPADTNYALQTFNSTECGAMSIGDVIALSDTRDNNTYTVAKLEDGNCWMTENLRLDPSTVTFDSTNTNSPTTTFITAAANSNSSNILCNTDDSGCVDTVRFNSNNINRSFTASYNANVIDRSWYSYGVMYNWYTATAGNGNFALNTGSAAGDICPTGWRLPTGGANSDFTTLNRLANNNATNTTAGLVKFPDNFIFSGDFNYNLPGGRGSYGRYWSSTPNGTTKAYRFGTAINASPVVTPTGSWNKWDAFAIRCVLKQSN